MAKNLERHSGGARHEYIFDLKWSLLNQKELSIKIVFFFKILLKFKKKNIASVW